MMNSSKIYHSPVSSMCNSCTQFLFQHTYFSEKLQAKYLDSMKYDELLFLESLINEFYNPSISNQRRRDIECKLFNYEIRNDSCKLSISFMDKCPNLFVRSFLVKVIENTVIKRWSKLSAEDQLFIRSSLYNKVFNLDNDIPPVIKKQLMKIIAKIALNESPLKLSDFVNDILNLILLNDVNMVSLGLASLSIATDELINPQGDMYVAKKNEFRKHFENCVPQIFVVLTGSFQKYKLSAAENEIIENILNLYAQLFSLLPLCDFYSSDLLLSIFECAIHNNVRLRMAALSALNEILYKNCVPAKSIPLIVTIFYKLNAILDHFLRSDANLIDDEFLTKVLEMVSLIFSQHWHRIEMNADGAAITSFLTHFYTLSFNRPDFHCYDSCLDIWYSFLEYLTMHQTTHVKQYESLLSVLLPEIIRKLQEKMVVENTDETEEMNSCLNQHMNLIDLLTEIMPNAVFTLVVDLWNSSKVVYVELLRTKKQLNMLSNPSEILEAVHRFDVSTQILTSLQSKLENHLKTVIIQDLAQIVNLVNESYLHFHDNLLSSRELLEVHCRLMKAIPAWVCFSMDKDGAIIATLFTSTLPFITGNHASVDSELQIAAAYLIGQLINCLRQSSSLQPLLVDPTFNHLPVEAQRSLQSALCSWVCNCKSESFEDRSKFLRSLFETVTSKKIENLENVTTIVRNSKITHSEGRDVLFSALEPWLEHIIEEYPNHFLKNVKLCDNLMVFLLEVFQILQHHVNLTLIQKVLIMFEKCFANSLGFSGECINLESMLALLTVLMENPGHSYKDYISNVLSVIQRFFCYIEARQSVTALPEFYKLLCCILLNKWPYFCKGIESNEKSLSQRRDEFEVLINFILSSFRQSDVNIVKNNLRCLEDMNVKWSLYSKELFRVKYLSIFLNDFLSILIDNSLSLLSEDVLTAVFNMAAVDFHVFFTKYIPLFLADVSGLTSYQANQLQRNLQFQTDLPSFVETIGMLINDVRSYRIENGCL